MDRREFIKKMGTAFAGGVVCLPLLTASGCLESAKRASRKKPNIVFVFADQWRAQAAGYSGDPNLQGKTPNLDKLAAESVNLTNAVSTCPSGISMLAAAAITSPKIASRVLITGKCLNVRIATTTHLITPVTIRQSFIGKVMTL